MAKNKTAKALYDHPMPSSPKMPRERRAEIVQCKNGYMITGGYDQKTGTSPKYIAKTEAEAKEIASKLL